MCTEMINIKVRLARQFACEYHGGQKYGDYPYVTHLDEVVKNIKLLSIPQPSWKDNLIVAGYLHDVLEDTEARFRDLVDAFGATPALYVAAVTGRGSRQRRLEQLCEALQECPPAAYIKLADRIANVENAASNGRTNLFNMYRRENERFIKVIKPYIVEHDDLERLTVFYP